MASDPHYDLDSEPKGGLERRVQELEDGATNRALHPQVNLPYPSAGRTPLNPALNTNG